MTNAVLRGKPDAGNPHIRFDEGEVASAATPRRGSLLYATGKKLIVLLAVISGVIGTAVYADVDFPTAGDGGGDLATAGATSSDPRATEGGAPTRKIRQRKMMVRPWLAPKADRMAAPASPSPGA